MEDVKWLGFEWDGEVRYASDYFGEMYEYAKKLISLGKAYVDDQNCRGNQTKLVVISLHLVSIALTVIVA